MWDVEELTFLIINRYNLFRNLKNGNSFIILLYFLYIIRVLKEQNSINEEQNSINKEQNSSNKEQNSSNKEQNSSNKELNSINKEQNLINNIIYIMIEIPNIWTFLGRKIYYHYFCCCWHFVNIHTQH